MTVFFLNLVQRSIEAALIASVLTILRALLAGRMARSVMRLLWLAVPLRLLLPGKLPILSARPTEGFQAAPLAGLPPEGGTPPPLHVPETAARFAVPQVAAWLWASMAVFLLICLVILYVRAGRRLMAGASPLREGLSPTLIEGLGKVPTYVCTATDSPVIWGLLSPRIFLPLDCGPEETLKLALAHERVHIRRRDYLLKPLAMALVAVHWFNPILWIAFGLWSRDVELACDESVVAASGNAPAYANALLSMAIRQNGLFQLGFSRGESQVRRRIQAILRGRKPCRAVGVVSVLLTLAALLCAFTGVKLPDAGTHYEESSLAPQTDEQDGVLENSSTVADYVMADVPSMVFPGPDIVTISKVYGWEPIITDPAVTETVEAMAAFANMHTGVDLTLENTEEAYGKDITAAAEGTVRFAEASHTPGYGYGKHLILEHEGGVSTLYAHCSELLVQEGEQVKQGQIIAKVGSTGFSPFPHLHFEVRIDGVPVDPMPWLRGDSAETQRQRDRVKAGQDVPPSQKKEDPQEVFVEETAPTYVAPEYVDPGEEVLSALS